MSEGRLRQKAAGRERLGDGERSIVCMHFKRDSGQRLSRTANKQRSMAKGEQRVQVRGMQHTAATKKNVSTSFIRFFSGAWRQHFSLACGDGGGSSSECVCVSAPAYQCMCVSAPACLYVCVFMCVNALGCASHHLTCSANIFIKSKVPRTSQKDAPLPGWERAPLERISLIQRIAHNLFYGFALERSTGQRQIESR